MGRLDKSEMKRDGSWKTSTHILEVRIPTNGSLPQADGSAVQYDQTG